jgi:PPE-repeat protein
VVLDYGALPPEINSARMYSGAGSASLEAAASAWNGLAAELNSAATGYDSVITQLASDEWLGPASTSMADAAAPYVAWMNTTATQAQEAATQARAAAAAYQQAFAATVPPPLIATNRAQTAQLISTNVLGQNTPAIAQLEAQYGQMWAQDATAMYTYAGQSAAATKVTPFDPPAQTTNPAGQAMQSAAVTQAASSATGTSAQSTLSQLTSSLNGLQAGLASPTGDPSLLSQLLALLGLPTSSPLRTVLSDILTNGFYEFPTNSIGGQLIAGIFGTSVISAGSPLNFLTRWLGPIYNGTGLPYFWTGSSNSYMALSKAFAPAAAAPPQAILIPPTPPALHAGFGGPGLGGGLGGLGGGLGPPSGVSGGLGGAITVGKLSAPPSWIGGAPSPTPAAPLAISTVAAAPEGHAAGNLVGGMPLPSAGAGGHGFGSPRYGFRPTVMARPPFAG